MSIKQVFANYDWQATKPVYEYRYCPLCGATLAQSQGDKPTCPNCGFIQFKNPSPAVSVLIAMDGKVLLGKRAESPGRDKWAMPSGYIEFEEDFISTGIRETKEETGLDVEILTIINVLSSFVSPRYHFLAIYLEASVIGGELAAGDDLTELQWFALSEALPEMAFQEDIYILSLYASHQQRGLPVNPEISRPKKPD